MLFAALGGSNAILSCIQSAARQRAIVALHQGGDSWLRSLVGAGFLLWLGATSTVAMIGYAFATLLVLSSQVFFFRNIASSIPNAIGEKNWDNKIWEYSWPIGIFGIFTWLQMTSDRWALQIFTTTTEVGNYAVLYQLGFYPISLITGMAMQFLIPILFQRAGDASDSSRIDGVNKLSWYLTWTALGLTSLIFLITLLFHALIFQILVAEEYNTLSYLLPWMILAGGVFASGQSLASSLLARMKTREMMVATIFTALIGLVLNFIGAYWHGVIGIVGSSVLFSTIYFICMVMLVKGANK